MTAEKLFEYALSTYKSSPEYLWAASPDSAVLRHKDNKKWYAVVMKVPYNILGIKKQGSVFVLDVKSDPFFIAELTTQKGFLPAYHMNKTNWISILLDGTAPGSQIKDLLNLSYTLTSSTPKKRNK